MKILLIVAGLQLSIGLFAQEIVVLAKGDSLVLGSTNAATELKDPAQASFLAAFKADLAHPATFAGPDKLSDLPEYGRKVPGAAGEIRYHGSFHGGFVIGVTLEGLTPNHKYILTLNGSPGRAGNDKLMETVDHNQKEKYYDFSTVTTDANGRYHATFGIRLPASRYDVHFYVKDTTDFKIVLYHDFFKFKVK
jgi:hypothetical protein